MTRKWKVVCPPPPTPRSADEEATATAVAACGSHIPMLPTEATVRVSRPLQAEG